MYRQQVKYRKFIKYLKDNNQWEEDINISNIVENKEVENDLDYNTYAYFYDNVRKAIYGNPNSIKKIKI